MGNKRKRETTRRRKFGIASGKHSFSVKKEKEKQAEKLSKVVRGGRKKTFVIKGWRELKCSFRKLCIDRAKRYIICASKKDSINIVLHAAQDNKLSGNRIVNLEKLRSHISDITKHTIFCDKAREVAVSGKDPIVLTCEKRMAFSVVLTAKCQGCKHTFDINNSDDISSDKGNLSDINVRAVWGNMVVGGGCSSLNESMGTLGIPGMPDKQYSRIEEQIGEWWKSVLEEDLKLAGEEEKEHAIQTNSYFQGGACYYSCL